MGSNLNQPWGVQGERSARVPRPNIILFLIDDMGWMDLGCQGSSFYETPRLDLLAQEGMRFTDAYASCPVCSPTRASIMTGKYPATVGITNFIGGVERGRLLEAPYLRHLPLSEHSLATALREGGYSTWHVGKWHLGGEGSLPEQHGFDVNVGGCGWGHPKNGYFSPYGNPKLADGPEGEYLTDRLTDEAIALIRGRGDRSFFLNFCHYAVHTPIQSPPDLVEKYRAKTSALGLDIKEPFEEGPPFPSEHKRHLRIRRRLFQSDPAYAAMVENLDRNIGRVLDALHEEGIADDTIVIFTSDNGGLATSEGSPTSNAPLSEGKGWMYEGGTREPLIVKWPGVTAPNSVCREPTTSPDFYPTCLEIAGLPLIPEQHVDAVSIAPLLRGGSLERGPVFWHYPHYGNQGGTPGCSVRRGDWKLIEFLEDRHIELYNLREDVGEERDLAGEKPEIAEALRAKLAEWLVKAGAKIPEPNPDWPPEA
jgi:arylsulfatase A-like enzyme